MWGDTSLWFWFSFPSWWVTLGSFSCTSGHLHVSFGKMSVQIFCPFKNWFVCLFAIELYEFFIYFGYFYLITYMIYKYCLPFIRLPFCFIDGFLCCEEAFSFDVVSLVYFCFHCLCFWCQIPTSSLPPPKNIAKTNIRGLLSIFSSRSFMVSRLMFKIWGFFFFIWCWPPFLFGWPKP